MSKYTRGADRTILEDACAAYYKLFVEDTDPTLEGLRNTLESQSASDAKVAKAAKIGTKW